MRRVPMYYEAKVLFVLYLWHPETQGAVYLFNHTVQPFLAQNEAAIDQALEEIKTTIIDHTSAYFHKYDVASQSLTLMTKNCFRHSPG